MMKYKNLIYLVIGFLVGCMITDYIHLQDEMLKRQASYEYGKLLMAVTERPKRCPVCKWEFHYLFEYDSDDFQKIIDEYLGD